MIYFIRVPGNATKGYFMVAEYIEQALDALVDMKVFTQEQADEVLLDSNLWQMNQTFEVNGSGLEVREF